VSVDIRLFVVAPGECCRFRVVSLMLFGSSFERKIINSELMNRRTLNCSLKNLQKRRNYCKIMIAALTACSRENLNQFPQQGYWKRLRLQNKWFCRLSHLHCISIPKGYPQSFALGRLSTGWDGWSVSSVSTLILCTLPTWVTGLSYAYLYFDGSTRALEALGTTYYWFKLRCNWIFLIWLFLTPKLWCKSKISPFFRSESY
jgi:hypothetical protein